MKKTFQGLGLVFFILLAIMILIGLPKGENGIPTGFVDKISILNDSKGKWPNPMKNSILVDNKAIYSADVDSNVDKLYVTVLPPLNKNSVTFEELNKLQYVSSEGYINDAFDRAVEVFFEADFPANIDYSNLKANAIMELRGQSARLVPPKSYKIKLFDSTQEWLGFSIINLNKHYFSALKIENKLAFDYFELLSDFGSLRTRFVRLYVKDLSSKTPDNNFQDYGFFTFIEQPNKKFLKNHNLDKNGHLYKAEFFEFLRYEDSLKLTDDITYDARKFEEILETRGNENHKKLIEMLEAVNDYNRDINQVVDKHFDRNNLMTWLAVNILFNNHDSNSRNFLLYSPLNSDKWFFLPWDYDKMVYQETRLGKWERGLSNYWGMVIFKRFFKDYDNVEAFQKKVEEISKIMNADNTRKLLDSYYGVVTENLYKPPDLQYQIPRGDYDQMYKALVNFAENNKKNFLELIQNPMPFFLGEPDFKKGTCLLNWEASFDLQGDDLVYELVIGVDPEFHSIVASYRGLTKTSQDVGDLKPGRYFWKVVAYDAKGNWQGAFDYYRDSNNNVFFGVKELVVK